MALLAAPPAVPVKVTMPPLEEMDGEPENIQIPWLPEPAPPPVPVTVTAAAPAIELPSLTRTPAELVPPAEPPVPVTWISPLVERIFPALRSETPKLACTLPEPPVPCTDTKPLPVVWTVAPLLICT